MAETPAPFGQRPLPPDLKREPLAMADAELAAALRERIDEFNELWRMADARAIEVKIAIVGTFLGGRPKLALDIAKKVPL